MAGRCDCAGSTFNILDPLTGEAYPISQGVPLIPNYGPPPTVKSVGNIPVVAIPQTNSDGSICYNLTWQAQQQGTRLVGPDGTTLIDWTTTINTVAGDSLGTSTTGGVTTTNIGPNVFTIQT